ncbi:MAG: primosomal protein N' [Alistipes sp.]|nr:primosomal protein N' [Alistipes sp.]
MRYADIVLPLAQPTYTYAVPEGMTLREGDAVSVQFGLRKYYTGIVWRLHDKRPDFKHIKEVTCRLYDHPLVSERQRALWEWVASYYMCTLGEVMRSALPALMKPSADNRATLLEEAFQPRTERYYRLAEELRDEHRLSDEMDRLERRAPKQYAALLEVASAEMEEVPRRLIMSDSTILNALIKKGFLICEEHCPAAEYGTPSFRLPLLSMHQMEALEALKKSFREGGHTALLQGITGSGKTEVYIYLIAEVLSRGGDVLLLVPEIALTAQLIERMERIFGARVTAYHSKLTPIRRAENFLRLSRSKGGEFVVGVRSSIFLPLNNLQLIIVDEEHDSSYKQAEPAPRYSARDTAVYMAYSMGCHTLLGSATPSLETWLNAETGRYGRAEMTERYGDAVLPKIYLSDSRRAAQRGERQGHFNKLLLDKIEAALGRNEQVMLFQNRRGFSPYLECPTCGWTPRCPHCNVTLTYHKGRNQLVCHYCGHTVQAMTQCPTCQVVDLMPMGFGTEKVEEQIAAIFPEARVARLDRDQVTSEQAFQAIIDDFSAHRTDILVGTQMITKGFDFSQVGVVGVLNADNLLLNPDFRASERAFQLLTQVAGRAGRRDRQGEVVIQTSDPTNPILQQVLNADFGAMARCQLAERRDFFYPPYARLTYLTLRHRDRPTVVRAASQLAASLRAKLGTQRVLGPIAPAIDRIRGEYLMQLMLKIEPRSSRARANALLQQALTALLEEKEYATLHVKIDVDPQ